MYLIYSLVIVIFFTIACTKTIREHSKTFYGLTSVIATVVTIYEILRLTSNYKLEGFLNDLERVFMKGNIAIVFFILVMFAGALNKRWKVTKKLLSIRAEMAIIGSILIIPHCIMYAVRFLVKLSEGKAISVLYITYLIIGLIAFIILIPLFITSFKKVRANIGFTKWKTIQKMAYPFYLLAYIHIVIVLFNDKELDWLKLISYTILFGGYFILKLINENKN